MIATRYGTTISELRSLNGIPPRSSLIRVGQTLRVAPAADPGSEPQAPPEDAAASEAPAETVTHVVKRGENMSTIAARYSMTVAELRMLNGMSAGHSLIVAGQRLVVRASEGVAAIRVKSHRSQRWPWRRNSSHSPRISPLPDAGAPGTGGAEGSVLMGRSPYAKRPRAQAGFPARSRRTRQKRAQTGEEGWLPGLGSNQGPTD